MTTTAAPDLSVRLHTPQSVADLVHRIESADRRLPVVIVSPHQGVPPYGVSPRRLAGELAGHAEVYAIATLDLAWELDAHPKHRTFGGAVRVTGSHDFSVVIRTDIDPEDAYRRIIDTALLAARRMDSSAEVNPPTSPRTCTASPADLARRVAGTRPLPVAAAIPSAPAPDLGVEESREFHTVPPLDAGRIERLTAALNRTGAERDEERRLRLAAEADLARTHIDLQRVQAQLGPLREQNRGLREQLSTAQHQVEALTTELDVARAPLFADPQTQLRDDITRTWLRNVTEPERDQYSLRSFRVGSAFLASLDTPLAPQSRILDVIVDVLTRRAYEMASRAVHPHGDGRSAGTTGQMVREDGAVAYRCVIRNNTPAAPRLLWWELTDGSVELALVARHDDPMPGTGGGRAA